MIERWNALSARARRVWTVAAALVAVFVLMALLNTLGRAPGGPSLSANSTGGDGLAAWDALLDGNGHRTSQLRADLDRADLVTSQTVVAIGQAFTRREKAALRRFVAGGGVLVIGDVEAETTLHMFGDRTAQWEPFGASVARVGTEGLSVRGPGFASWRASKGHALAQGGTRVVAVQVAYGQGSVIALADPSPVTNAWLDRGDNAWFAVHLVGRDGRGVAFAEHGHGYGTTSGFGALPARWKTAFWFAGIAALVGAWAAGKRLGPADPVVDAAPPERARYVYAVASTLARTRDREAAVEPLRRRARDLLARRSGRQDLDTPDGVRAAGRVAGLSDDDVAALLAPLADDHDLVALARTVSHLEEH